MIVVCQEDRRASRSAKIGPARVGLEIGELRDALLNLDESQARGQHVQPLDAAADVRDIAHDGLVGGEAVRAFELIAEELVERASRLVALLPLLSGIRQTVALVCGSRSMTSTRLRCSRARKCASASVMVVLPTPPLRLMMLVTYAIGRFLPQARLFYPPPDLVRQGANAGLSKS